MRKSRTVSSLCIPSGRGHEVLTGSPFTCKLDQNKLSIPSSQQNNYSVSIRLQEERDIRNVIGRQPCSQYIRKSISNI